MQIDVIVPVYAGLEQTRRCLESVLAARQATPFELVLVDDCGTRLNPSNVEGMIDGGFVQGIGMALFEEYAYDDEGQPLVTSFMDYLLPTIYEAPMTEKKTLVTPSPFTPLGAKGCGEGAMHTTPAAILAAINDALAPFGVRATEIPATPNRLWTLLQGAGRAEPGSPTREQQGGPP